MENRKIMIANNKTQRRYTIETSATTLGELQDQMVAQGIDFSGMTFTEGISKTQLLTRDSLLPTNVMYKGQPTNNLVMLLTNSTKNIPSGAMSRKEAYQMVKVFNLQDAIKEGEEQNYTRVSTEVLESYINAAQRTVNIEDGLTDLAEDVENTYQNVCDAVDNLEVKTAPHADLVELLYLNIKYMTKTHTLVADDVAVIANLTKELSARLKESEPVITDKDIDDMMANI